MPYKTIRLLYCPRCTQFEERDLEENLNHSCWQPDAGRPSWTTQPNRLRLATPEELDKAIELAKQLIKNEQSFIRKLRREKDLCE